MNKNIYYIWLQNALKPGSHKIRTVNLLYDNIENFYNANEHELRLCGCFTSKELEALSNKSLDSAEKIVRRCDERGYKILTLEDQNYPHLLKEIINPPAVLYINGDERVLSSDLPIAIVGTRSATAYGKEISCDIARDLAREGAIIVSGGAVGVDYSAHSGALDGGGKTVAVLGCGINYPYLMQNASMRSSIAKNGAVVSEYPPDYPPSAYSFPVRNRIISGLSLGTVVIEAGAKSGSLITANLANEQNRDVFVVPVEAQSKLAQGALDLIRDGAQVITCAQNILDEYKGRTSKDFNYAKSSQKLIKNHETLTADKAQDDIKKQNQENMNKQYEKNMFKDFSEESKKIYSALKKGKMHIDEIIRETGISSRIMLSELTELELLGVVKAFSGRMYSLSKKN